VLPGSRPEMNRTVSCNFRIAPCVFFVVRINSVWITNLNLVPEMKTSSFICSALLAALVCAVPLRAETKSTSLGHVDFGEFTAPDEGQFVEVHIQKSLINMVARLAEKDEPEVAKILRGLEAVRVNVIGVNDDNRAELKRRIRSVRSQLMEKGWESVATVQDKKEEIGVFVKLKGEEAVEGIAVTVLSGDEEAVFVNIVGNIRPDQIAELGERLHIDPLKKLSRELGGAK